MKEAELWKSIPLFSSFRWVKSTNSIREETKRFLYFLCATRSELGGRDRSGCIWLIAAAIASQRTHSRRSEKETRWLASVQSEKALKLPLKADFISQLSALQTQHSGALLSQLAFHLSQTPKIDPVSVGPSQEFKYSEDGAMINPPAVHGAVLSSFHLLGGALFHWFILQTWPSMAWFYDAGGMRRAPLCNACEIKWERKKSPHRWILFLTQKGLAVAASTEAFETPDIYTRSG